MPPELPSHDDPSPPWPQLILRRADQVTVAAILAVSLATILAWCLRETQLRGRLIDIETAAPLAVQFQLDINNADWPEIALLPNIGEQLAKRIIADRQANGPFPDIAALSRVRGIGPRTIEAVKPYLLPLPPPTATAGNPAQRPVLTN